MIETLSPAEAAEIEAQLGLSGPPNLRFDVARKKSPNGKIVVTYDELKELRELEVPLLDLWIRVEQDDKNGLVPASKVEKYIMLGYRCH